MAIKLGLKGMEELKKKLGKVEVGLSDELETATRAGALIVQNSAKDRAPFLTGTLKRSIHMETTEKNDRRVIITVGTDVVYAAAQEFGTSRGVPAHPYLRPALDENQDAVKKEIMAALKDILRKV